jgi:hypothetical protein
LTWFKYGQGLEFNRTHLLPVYDLLWFFTVPPNKCLTSNRTQHFTITNINWLMPFKEIIAVYSENDTKPKLV